MKIKIISHAALFCVLSACVLNNPNAVAATPDSQAQTAGAKVSGAIQADAQEPGTRFKGSVGQARFEMVLRREGGELSGSYFYLKSGSANRLKLRGKIGADGSFTLQEFDAAGRQTGEFSGKWKDDPEEAGASLEGEWKKPGGAGEGQSFWASEQTISFSGGTQIVNRRVNESVRARRLDISAEYPELSGGANAAAFNQLVKTRVTAALADFRKQMAEMTAEDLKMLPAGANNYIDIGYDVVYADDDLVSVTFSESTFAGGAHPNTNYFTINYDLKQGRELKLSDLFKPGARYLEAVSAYSTRDLRARTDPESKENMGLAQDIFADGAKPTAENYARWNITKKGLMFTFDPYQVGPYAYGPQTVVIPYASLREIARPGGPLAKAAK